MKIMSDIGYISFFSFFPAFLERAPRGRTKHGQIRAAGVVKKIKKPLTRGLALRGA
jgi:hypothetical protein